MARILIRPDDLARLAQRFDAAADDLARSGRRLARSRAEVRLNAADETFPAVRVAERAGRVEAELRRLSADFQVDAGMMARTVDAAELDGDGRWIQGLQPVVGSEAPAAAGSLATVAAGLMSLPGSRSPSGDGGSRNRSVGAGGLFVASSCARAGADQELLAGLTERLGASPSSSPPADAGGPGGPAAQAVWTRIVDELFSVDD